MTNEVFISHASGDAGLAAKVCETIEGRGLSCWLASRDIRPGRDYPSALAEALSACHALVLILSREANASPHVVREVERAVDRGILIIPLRVDSVELSAGLDYLLSSVQWLDATAPDRSAALQLMLSTLDRELGPRSHSTQPSSMVAAHPSDPIASEGRGRMFGNLRGAAVLVGIFALFAVSWLARLEHRWESNSASSGVGGTPPEVTPVSAGSGSATLPDSALASGGRADGTPSAGGAGKGPALATPADGPAPAPSRLCCTEAGVGKYCSRPRCEDCGLRSCQ